MDLHKDYWNNKYSGEDEFNKVSKTSEFVQFAVPYFPKTGEVLELGAGIGHDIKYLLSQGYLVTAADFSDVILNHLKETLGENQNIKITNLDLTKPFDLPENEYDAIFANLVLHYFDKETTKQIYDEIYRVLKPGGILAVMVNTIIDPEYGQGVKLEDDYFELRPGRPKRYFSKESLKEYVGEFETILLDDKGLDSRRGHKANLIRFIGKK